MAANFVVPTNNGLSGGGTYLKKINLGTISSFDVKTILPESYKTLTNENFGMAYCNISSRMIGNNTIRRERNWGAGSWDYNSNTGILTVYNVGEWREPAYQDYNVLWGAASQNMNLYYIAQE